MEMINYKKQIWLLLQGTVSNVKSGSCNKTTSVHIKYILEVCMS